MLPRSPRTSSAGPPVKSAGWPCSRWRRSASKPPTSPSPPSPAVPIHPPTTPAAPSGASTSSAWIDREFFFGREAPSLACESALTEHPLPGHPGPLRQWQVLPRPGRTGARPASALARTPPGLPAPRLRPLTQLQSVLQEAGLGPLIVVADQFEELFTHTQDEAQRTAFLDLILAPSPTASSSSPCGPTSWGSAAYPALREAIQAHEELIAPMDGPDLRRAIDQQAGVVGLRFEAELSFTIVEDVQNEPGAMPCCSTP